jgi:hypothetical protein
MDSVSIQVDVPDGVNPKWVEQKAAQALRYITEDAKRELEYLQVLEDDDAMNIWISREFHGTRCFCRASVYGGRYKRHYGEIFPWKFQDDDRRPVAMLGSVNMMIQKYAHWMSPHCANRYCEAVLQRYMRKIKYTCFERDPPDNMIVRVMGKLRSKHYTSYHFGTPGCWSAHDDSNGWRGSCRAWVNGRYQWLTGEQFKFLKMMYGVIQKSDRVEERIALLREARDAARQECEP